MVPVTLCSDTRWPNADAHQGAVTIGAAQFSVSGSADYRLYPSQYVHFKPYCFRQPPSVTCPHCNTTVVPRSTGKARFEIETRPGVYYTLALQASYYTSFDVQTHKLDVTVQGKPYSTLVTLQSQNRLAWQWVKTTAFMATANTTSFVLHERDGHCLSVRSARLFTLFGTPTVHAHALIFYFARLCQSNNVHSTLADYALAVVTAVADSGPITPASCTCSNTCTSHGDQSCDDGGPGSNYSVCALGTDCADCGPSARVTLAKGASCSSPGVTYPTWLCLCVEGEWVTPRTFDMLLQGQVQLRAMDRRPGPGRALGCPQDPGLQWPQKTCKL